MADNGIFDTTNQLLQANLDRRTRSHRLIARNISNIDTPNYRGTGLEFEKQLAKALDGGVLPASMVRTNPMHMPQEDPGPFAHAKGRYKDTGPVHLDIEMTKLAENNIMFNAMVQLLNKRLSGLKNAITEAGSK